MSDNMNIKGLLDAQGRAFEALKAELDATKQDTAKIARIEKSLEEIDSKIEEVTLKAGRPGSSAKSEEVNERKEAFLRYVSKGDRALTVEEQKAMAATSADAKDGSYSVPGEFEAGIIKKMYEVNPIRSLVNVTTTSTQDKEFLYELGEMSGGWVLEEGARSNTATAQIGNIIVPVHELYANPSATRRILADSKENLEAWLTGLAAEKLGRIEALAALSGDGTNKIKGILEGSGTASQTALGEVETASATAITFDDIINQVYSLNQSYSGNQAVFMGNKLIIKELRKIKDLEGRYVWQPAQTAGEPSTVLGYGFYTNSDMASAVVADAKVLVFGDLKSAYSLVDRTGSMIMMRDDITDKRYVQFYTTYRVGGAVVNGFAANVLVGKA